MSKKVIQVENLSKQYRLGQVGTGTISHDLNRWWHRVRGKEDPYLKIGESNDRATKGESEYVWALKDINFEVKQGEVLGIIGKNGAGKSTLLKLLSKVTAPTTGSIKAKGRIASLLEVGTGFHPELTGRENIFLNGTILGMTKAEVKAKLDEIVDFAGVERYLDTPVKRYSSGMMVRLGFAVAAHLEPEILIVDEVLAVGDAEFQKKAIGKMQEVSAEGGRTVLFVSHNMGSVGELCGKALLLESGRVSFVDDSKIVIQKYLSNQGSNTKKYPETSPIRYLEINQDGNTIVLNAHYQLKHKYKILILGFVLYDHLGNPIFGSNPQIQRVILPSDIKLNGKINACVKEPALLDGSYTVSVWLGDGVKNFFHDANCLSIDIQGMTNILQLNKSVVGAVAPKVKYLYE